MGEMTDKFKGRSKEVAGSVTGDRKLEAEGKKDYSRGKVKEGFERLKEGLRGLTRKDNPHRY
jgi:uncharacterized protein YjbJ (UPF0337 family)